MRADGQTGGDRVVRRRVRLHRGTVPDRGAEHGFGRGVVFRKDRRDRGSFDQQHGTCNV